MNARTLCCLIALLVLGLGGPARAADNVLITELMAVNDGMLLDEDGAAEDWVELHNAGTNTVNLDGWFLTDKFSQLTQWRFPATNLPPNGYLIVFASGKNRRLPGAPLHTNFKLGSGGEYLGLVRPDGITVVSAYAPAFPAQVSGVSFGLSVVPTSTTLLASGAVARVRVPTDGSLDPAWRAPGFNDASWSALPTGVGFETDGLVPFVPVTMANSVTEFSGTQGQSNWSYGFWDKKNDNDGQYAETEFVTFPNSGGGWSAGNFWTGSMWDWFAGDPPETQLTGEGGRPAGDNGNGALPDHWAIRRYVNEFDGAITFSGRITHTSDWVYVTQSGIAGTGLIYLYTQAAGEGYIDDIKLVAGLTPESGANLISNGDFEAGTFAPWNVTLNMANSTITTAIRHAGARSLRLYGSAAGSTQTDSIWQSFTVSAGAIYTLSYWYLPVTNGPSAVIRASGNWLNTVPLAPGDGVVGRIFVDGVEVHQEAAYVSTADYSVTVPAHLGSKVDFAIDAGPSNNGIGDGTVFTATVSTADPTVQVVADSVADWSSQGVQGEKNWFYGYYFEGVNTNTPPYYTSNFVAFPRDNGPYGPNNFWDGERWKWFDGPPPGDEIGPAMMNPTGLNYGLRHWVIRRWISTVSGRIVVTWTIAKPDITGGGVTGRILHNGTQRDQAVIQGNATELYTRTITITNVQVGDIIDVALDPRGLFDQFGDGGDRSYVTAVIRGSPSVAGQVASSMEASMKDVNASAYLRLPFNVPNPALVHFLTLRMRYDDGFVAYLNGQFVAGANAPASPAWNSTATATRSDAEANGPQEFNLTAFVGLLQPGANVLAIQGLNVSAADADFLILPELIGTSVSLSTNAPLYFTQVTPGAANGAGTAVLGPVIRDGRHQPNVPFDHEDLQISARVTPSFNPLNSVSLTYRVMFSNEVTIPMFDDGAHGDGAAADGEFGARIPAGASQPGQMVRYFIFATDTQTNGSRFPAYDRQQDSPRYLGTVVKNPALTNPLPVLDFFVENPALATNTAGTRCSIFYDGEFYDNIAVNLHGQTTASVFPKRSMNFDLNSGHKFLWDRDQPRVNDFILLTTAPDKAYMRNVLAYEAFADAGVPSFFCRPVRLQQNGAFHSVMHLTEQGDGNFLDRVGLDAEGALYKVYLPLESAYAGVAEKKTRKAENFADLEELIDGINLNGTLLRNYLYDNIDLPEVINFLATIQHVQNEDCCWYKNFYLYRDSRGTKEWQMLPWDLDLTFGRGFVAWQQVGTNTYGGYYDTNLYPSNLYYTQSRAAHDFIGQTNGAPYDAMTLAAALWKVPEIYDMFLRRWTSVQEEQLQKPGTHPLLLKLEQRADSLAAQIAPDAALDFVQWAPVNPPTFLPGQTLPQAVALLKTQYLAARRPWIFNTLAYANGGPNVGTQPSNAIIRFGAIEYNPASGNQNQEYLQLANTNSYAVDLSGWRLTGAVDYTFRGGVVIPSNSVLYLSPDVNAFRARTSGPRGGIGDFVQGNYKGSLSARGESLQLVDKTGRPVAATNYAGAPSLAQQYLRVTEIMYHPAPPPPGLAVDADEFEFVELKNIGPAPLSLIGVRLTNGVFFNFTGGSITNLAAGASVIVVRNLAAFTSRYGAGLPVAGQYAGLLENSGETIRLEDAAGEKILEFAYNNSWYPVTDGEGFSLAIVNENADWSTWGLKESWRPSSRERGSPGLNNPPLDLIAPILINELTSHTVPPALDTVELYNPAGTNVDIGGWFLSDDFLSPRKYRIPDFTLVPAGGRILINESQFNPTNPPSPTGFAFSSTGDEVYLFSATAAGDLTGYFHGFSFGAGAAGVSFGRYVNSVGAEHFVAQSAATFGGLNAGPRIDSLVISEVHYHPPDLAGGADNSTDEFLELQNIAPAEVALYHADYPTNTWRLRGNVDFDFPTNVSLAPNGFVLLVNFHPTNAALAAAFRSRFNVPATVPLFGPYSGQLDNSSGDLRLLRPDAPLAGEVPYILVDEVDYSDQAPWSPAADGDGPSLQRIVPSQYGNDPINWIAAAPGAGRTGTVGAVPSITAQPVGQNVLATAPATFTVSASGTGPLRYQWQFNGSIISGATNAAYTVGSVNLTNAGFYGVLVFNGAGAAQSSNALLTVGFGPYFTVNPTNFGVRTGNTATFSAAAFGNGPLTFQWLFNGTSPPGTVTSTASNTTLTITNAQAAYAGSYTALATDGVGTVPSVSARLAVLVDPIILQSPLSQSLVAGASVTLSVTVSNTATLPLGFRWRKNSVPITNGMLILNQFTAFYVVTNVQSPAGTYSVVVTNAARPSGVNSLGAVLTLMPDTDGDGIPDAWEDQHGLASGSAADRDLDADGDGMSNWAEYVAGTNPTNALSYLWVEAKSGGPGATVSFGAISNRTYTVQAADGLENAQWFKLVDFVARTSNRVEVLNDPAFTSGRYYRVTTPQQP